MTRFAPYIKRFPTLASLLALVFVGGSCVTTEIERPESQVYTNVHGEPVDPLACSSGRLAALIFITVDCPIANGYAPQLKSLFTAFQDKSVDFYLVHVDPSVDVAAARKHAEEYGYGGRVILLDPKHQLVERCGIRFTPEAVLLSSDGTMHYRGRINNWYGDIGRKRFRASRHELRDAIASVLVGDPVKVPRTEAVGCEIEDIFEVDRSPSR